MVLDGLMLLTLIPAGLVMLVGLWAGPRVTKEDQDRRWLLILVLTAIALLVPTAVHARNFWTGQAGLLLFPLLPALEGVLALMLIKARSLYAGWQKEKSLFSALFLALALPLAAIALIDYFVLLAISLPPIILAGLWAAGQRLNASGLAALSAVVGVWLLLEALGVGESRRLIPVTWSRAAHTMTRLVGVALAYALMALLIYRSAKSQGAENRRRVRWALLLAGFLVVGLVAGVVRSGLLIKTTGRAAEDHLPWAEVLAAIIVGMVLTGVLEERRRTAGLIVLIAAPILMVGAYGLGWQIDGQAITQQRADRLSQAIERYQGDMGAYPPSLSALTPRYAPFILRPITGRGQVWCYEGGQDYFRLGYVIYQRYYGPTFPDPYYEIKIYSSAGQPPDGGWMCDNELKRLEITAGL